MGDEISEPRVPTATDHTRRLLAFVQRSAKCHGKEVLQRDLERIYMSMCAQLKIEPRAWNTGFPDLNVERSDE